MKGKCLCERIEFCFEPRDDCVLNCYCSICRRSHGASCATQVISRTSSLIFVTGEDCLKEYSSSNMGIRVFCVECGARLMNYAAKGSEYMSVALSCISSKHALSPSINIQVASKPDWAHIDENLESFEALPLNIGKYF